jgi:cytochrome bd-type quinol oxidase subunit 1
MVVLRGRGSDVTWFALRMSMVIAFLGAGGMFATGDLQTREVQAYQPVKFAAMEGVCQTPTAFPWTSSPCRRARTAPRAPDSGSRSSTV